MIKNNAATLHRFLVNINSNIIKNVNFDNYFELSNEKKMTTITSVFKIIDNSIKFFNTKDNENDIIKLVVNNLIKLTETNENYELSAILKDILNNFDSLFDTVKPSNKIVRTIIVKTPK